MVKRLTKSNEDKLISSLNRIADLTNDGTDPNEAIAKIASEEKVPSGHIQLLVNAYNTGRSAAQRKSHDSVWDKAAEFPIADTEAILEIMYPSKVKTASDIEYETSVSSDYSTPPHWVTRREEKEKKAEALQYKINQPKAVPYPGEEINEYKVAKDKLKKLAQDLEESRYKANFAFAAACSSKDNLVEYFKQADCIPFEEVKENAELLYGESGVLLFSQLKNENPRFVKQSSKRVARPAIGKPYELLKECMELSNAYQILKDDYHQKQASYDDSKSKFTTTFSLKPKLDPILGIPTPKDATYKEAGFFGSFGSGAKTMMKGVGNKVLDMSTEAAKNSPVNTMRESKQDALKDIYKEQYKSKLTPSLGSAHEDMVDSINREAMLSDILANDEVLSRRNPNDVLQAYSSIRTLAPRAAQNPEILRTLLRQRVEQGTSGDLFNIEAITRLEHTLAKLDGSLKDDK